MKKNGNNILYMHNDNIQNAIGND